MITHPYSDDPHQDAEAVRAFFDQWEVYRRVREADCLHHRAAYAALRVEAGNFVDFVLGDYGRWARAAGFAGVTVRFADAEGLYALFEARA